MMAQRASALLWRWVISRQAAPWAELDSFGALAPPRQRETLAARLLAQIQYFGRRADALPEWREAASLTDAQELWKAWPSLPIVTKDTLQSHFDPREMQPRFQLEGRSNATGGSTGEPTRVFLDTAALRAGAAAQIYSQLSMGWRPGMALVKLWGSERDIGNARRLRTRVANRLLRSWIVDGFAIDHAAVQRVLDLIRRHRPVAVSGYSSMLEYLARTVLERGERPSAGSVATAWNGGEMLLPNQVHLFQQAFGVPVLNCYGGRELSVMAFQSGPDQPLQVLRPWLFAEVVDEGGRPVAPGETGRLLWTSTVCRGTPFLRYDIGDLAAFERSDETEAGLVTLRSLHGRTAGLLRLPSGKTINNIFWNHLFKDFDAVRQFQVVLQGSSRLKIRLVGGGVTGNEDTRMRQVLRDFLEDVPFEVSWVDRLPLTSQGKLIQVIRED